MIRFCQYLCHLVVLFRFLFIIVSMKKKKPSHTLDCSTEQKEIKIWAKSNSMMNWIATSFLLLLLYRYLYDRWFVLFVCSVLSFGFSAAWSHFPSIVLSIFLLSSFFLFALFCLTITIFLNSSKPQKNLFFFFFRFQINLLWFCVEWRTFHHFISHNDGLLLNGMSCALDFASLYLFVLIGFA